MIKYYLFLIPFLSWGCSEQSIKTNTVESDTTYDVITAIWGDTILIKPIVKGKANGISRFYYKTKQLKSTSIYVDDKLNGESITYTKGGKIANKETYKNDLMVEKIVYWQQNPYNEDDFNFISEAGVFVFKNGDHVYDFGSNPPDGLIVEKFENGNRVFYIYKSGKLELYPTPSDK